MGVLTEAIGHTMNNSLKQESCGHIIENSKHEAEDDMRRKLVIVDLTGGGYVTLVPFDKDNSLSWNKLKVERWEKLRGLRDFCVVTKNNQLYVIGGVLIEERKCSSSLQW